jgi:hypothetical protein
MMHMECPLAPEVKTKLLSPPYRWLLQKYCDRFKVDPSFLSYHRASTLIAIRQELNIPLEWIGRCAACDKNTLSDCQLVDLLNEAIQERIEEEREQT